MSLSPDEAAEIRQGHKNLQSQYDKVLKAIKDNTESVNNLVIEMSKRDVKDEYIEKELSETKVRQEDFESFARPILVKAKEKQDFEKKVKYTFNSSEGRLILVIVSLVIAAAFGLDLSAMVR